MRASLALPVTCLRLPGRGIIWAPVGLLKQQISFVLWWHGQLLKFCHQIVVYKGIWEHFLNAIFFSLSPWSNNSNRILKMPLIQILYLLDRQAFKSPLFFQHIFLSLPLSVDAPSGYVCATGEEYSMFETRVGYCWKSQTCQSWSVFELHVMQCVSTISSLSSIHSNVTVKFLQSNRTHTYIVGLEKMHCSRYSFLVSVLELNAGFASYRSAARANSSRVADWRGERM